MMNEGSSFSPGSDELSAQFATLLQRWQKAGHMPLAAMTLLNEIIEDRPDPTYGPDEDKNMLSLVASDAASGVNIAQKYPRFFLRLIENNILLEDFLDILDVLYQAKQKADIFLPSTPSVDLSFLPSPKPSIFTSVVVAAKTVTKTFLQETINQLNRRLLVPQQTAMAMRRVLSLPVDEDAWLTLLRQNVELGEERWQIRLEGTPDNRQDESLRLELGMIPMLDLETIPPIEVTVRWGSYTEQRRLDDRGRAVFPPISLSTIIDEEAETVKADLFVDIALVD